MANVYDSPAQITFIKLVKYSDAAFYLNCVLNKVNFLTLNTVLKMARQ